MDRPLFAIFCDEVRERFAFLADHGWKEREARWPLVEYRSPVMRLVIWLRPAADDEHFFAVVALGAVDSPDDAPLFSLFELYSRNHPDATNSDVDSVLGRRFFPANDREQIAGSLERIETLLRAEGPELLEDRPGLIEDLRRLDAEHEQEWFLDQARPTAMRAFEAEDWATVVGELEPFEGSLKRSEQMKLDYARRHL